MKRIGIKKENGREPYKYCYSKADAEDFLNEYTKQLTKEGDALKIRVGNDWHFIDFNEDGEYDYEIARVMYYIKDYLDW